MLCVCACACACVRVVCVLCVCVVCMCCACDLRVRAICMRGGCEGVRDKGMRGSGPTNMVALSESS